jgi:hypothetical protein
MRARRLALDGPPRRRRERVRALRYATVQTQQGTCNLAGIRGAALVRRRLARETGAFDLPCRAGRRGSGRRQPQAGYRPGAAGRAEGRPTLPAGGLALSSSNAERRILLVVGPDRTDQGACASLGDRRRARVDDLAIAGAVLGIAWKPRRNLADYVVCRSVEGQVPALGNHHRRNDREPAYCVSALDPDSDGFSDHGAGRDRPTATLGRVRQGRDRRPRRSPHAAVTGHRRRRPRAARTRAFASGRSPTRT